MNKKQRELLVALKEALKAQPSEPSYSDYKDGTISIEEYENQCYEFKLVEDVKDLLRN